MTLRTAFTERFGITHPIALAPMGSTAGGELAAAVSNGGGLGIVGGGREGLEWIDRELSIVSEKTEKPWGIGFLSWAASEEMVTRALEYKPHVVMLSFGNPARLAEIVRSRG